MMNGNEDEFPPNASAKLSKVFQEHTDEFNSSPEFSNLLPARKKSDTPPNNCKISLIQAYVVGCFLLKKSGYEDVGNCGLALLGNDSSGFYIIYVYKKDNSKVCRVVIQHDLELEVESKNYLCFKDLNALYWSLYFKKEEDLYDFVEKVHLLRWKVRQFYLSKIGATLNAQSVSPILQKSCKGDGKRVSQKRPIRANMTYSRFVNESLSEKSDGIAVLNSPPFPWILRVLPKKLKINDEFIMVASLNDDFSKEQVTNHKYPVFLKLKILGNDGSCGNETDRSEVESCAPTAPSSRSTSPMLLLSQKVEEPKPVSEPLAVNIVKRPVSPVNQSAENLNAIIEKLDSLTSLVASMEDKIVKKTSELENKMFSLEGHVRDLTAANNIFAAGMKDLQNKIIEGVLSNLDTLKNDIVQQVKDNIEVNLTEYANQMKETKDVSAKLIALMGSLESALTKTENDTFVEKNANELASILPKLPEFDVIDVPASVSSPLSSDSTHDIPSSCPPSTQFHNKLTESDELNSDESDDY